MLAKEVQGVRAPLVAVLGNHDYESGHAEEVKEILTAGGVIVLDGESVEVHGLGIAGIKGFCGGFGRYSLGPWGESATKAFVHEAIDEALKLESALARLRTPQRLALLHFSPIRGTVEGEPLEIYPFLGSSRLEEPLLRYPVSAAVGGRPRARPQGLPRRHDEQRRAGLQRGPAAAAAALPRGTALSPDRAADRVAAGVADHRRCLWLRREL